VFFTAGVHWSKVPLSLFAAQYSDFTCLWMSSSSFNDPFIHTPRYFTWFKNCTRTPFRKTFDGAGFLYFFGQKRTSIVLLQLKVTGLEQIFGQVYRIRVGPDYSLKILDWSMIAKISDRFNTIGLAPETRCDRSYFFWLLLLFLRKWLQLLLWSSLEIYTATTLYTPIFWKQSVFCHMR